MNETQEETRSCWRKAKYTSPDTFKSGMKDIPAGCTAAAAEGEHQFPTARERSRAAPLFTTR